ncbi:hypothetical protein ACT4UT_28540 [Bacillus sp. B-TM1]
MSSSNDLTFHSSQQTLHLTLDEETRAQVAAEVSPFIIKAAQHIRDKQKILEEMIMTNDGRMKANSFYGKF